MEAFKVLARRPLSLSEQSPTGWTSTSLAERGESEFIQLLLRASDGDPFDTSTAETAQDDFRELVEGAGTAFDASTWFAIADERGDIGVVLPQVFADDPRVGTLFYVAVVPERRGEGLGRALHRWGLGQFALRGGTRHTGSTDPANQAMIAIFRHNGCEMAQG